MECYNKMHTFALTISRGGAVVARQAHNLEVIGSNPVSATKGKSNREIGCFFVLYRWFKKFDKTNILIFLFFLLVGDIILLLIRIL